MVKLSKRERSVSASCEVKFKGVRKRKWGKYVSEIRLPNSRERIWLGSFDSAEKAARAFDAALFLLRGRDATFNFPDRLPESAGEGRDGSRLTQSEIQAAATKFANSDSEAPSSSADSPSHSSSSRTTDSDLTTELEGSLREAPDDSLEEPIDFGMFPGIEEFPTEFFGMGMEGTGSRGVEDDGALFLTEEDPFLWSY